MEQLPGEVSTLNNRVAITINGVRDRLRVLLVSGEPHAGERTWRRLLKADPAVDLVHFTILRPPEKDDLTPLNELALIAFPTRELFQQKIGEFDLIILDRFQNRGILPPPYLRNIADYVRHGGALLMDVGPEFASPSSLDDTPLRDILPAHPLRGPDGELGNDGVVDGAFRPAVTALGTRHPVTEGLPGWHADASPSWGSWYRRIGASDLHGSVLLSAEAGTTGVGTDAAPLLLLERVEQGRVALLLSDQIWLWSRGHQGGGPQAELLRRVAHWLMRQPALEEDALTARIVPGRRRGHAPDRQPYQHRGCAPAADHGDRTGWVVAEPDPEADRSGSGQRQRPGDCARGLAGQRRRAHRFCRRRHLRPAGVCRPAGDRRRSRQARPQQRRQRTLACHPRRRAGGG